MNAQELQTHISRYAEIGNSQPFTPDVGDPFVMELAQLRANTLASAKSLISGQRTRACRQPLASPQDSGQLSTSISVKTRRSSLPVVLRGSSSMNTTSRGTL